jgi:RNA polymerase sigma factor (sigma-70 family)
MKKEENCEIVEGIKRGDTTTLRAFYDVNLPKITHYILNHSGNAFEAKDVFQDALVILYQKLNANTLELECAVSTYFFAICKHLWLNRLRKQGKMIIQEDTNVLDHVLSKDAIDAIERKEKVAVVQKYCLKLGAGCQKILLLFYSGYSIKEIAAQKGFTEGYTRKRKFECQKKLTEMFEKDPVFIELKESFHSH